MGERIMEDFRFGGEDCGEPKLVWSSGEVTEAVAKIGGSGSDGLLSKSSGGGIALVVCIAVGGGTS